METSEPTRFTLLGGPLQYSCLENPMNREAWWATVCGVAKSRTQLSMWPTSSGGPGFPLAGHQLRNLQKSLGRLRANVLCQRGWWCGVEGWGLLG